MYVFMTIFSSCECYRSFFTVFVTLCFIFFFSFIFFFNDTATTEIYTLSYTTLFRSQQAKRGGESLRHSAEFKRRFILDEMIFPLSFGRRTGNQEGVGGFRISSLTEYSSRDDNMMRTFGFQALIPTGQIGRAHRLNSSHITISYAVFCLKKKKKEKTKKEKKKQKKNNKKKKKHTKHIKQYTSNNMYS